MDAITVVGPRSLLRSGLVSLLKTVGFEPVEDFDSVAYLKNGATAGRNGIVVCLMRDTGELVGTMDDVKSRAPSAKLVFVAPTLDLGAMSACYSKGGSGYLLDKISCDALAESLKLVNAGEKVFPSDLASLFPTFSFRNSAPRDEQGLRTSDLSRREIQILQCLTSGQSNKVIANSLHIAEATVKVHVKRILRKARVTNRTQAAMWGIALGVAPAHDRQTTDGPALTTNRPTAEHSQTNFLRGRIAAQCKMHSSAH